MFKFLINFLYFSFLLARHKAALEVYNEISRQQSSIDWEVLHNQGICHLYLKEFTKAKEYLKAAIDNSRHEISFIHLGRVFALEGNLQSAIDTYKQALEYVYKFIFKYNVVLLDKYITNKHALLMETQIFSREYRNYDYSWTIIH